MELKLSSEEVSHIILEWAQAKFPEAQFNDLEFSSYSYSRDVTLSHVEPEPLKAVA